MLASGRLPQRLIYAHASCPRFIDRFEKGMDYIGAEQCRDAFSNDG